ncbi:hypothetical protein EB796_020694 [Bugula neritina]|uniref:Uncharacterized protein n=1 Tax=Bugula neritina TaxID=10212 RepID=A0A7J7J5A9_BUGNE|nr:hypothetical protein EB796_020694 [Bugula neritina]
MLGKEIDIRLYHAKLYSLLLSRQTPVSAQCWSLGGTSKCITKLIGTALMMSQFSSTPMLATRTNWDWLVDKVVELVVVHRPNC